MGWKSLKAPIPMVLIGLPTVLIIDSGFKSFLSRTGMIEPIEIQKKTDKRGVDFTNAHNVRWRLLEETNVQQNFFQETSNDRCPAILFAGYIQWQIQRGRLKAESCRTKR